VITMAKKKKKENPDDRPPFGWEEREQWIPRKK